MTANQVQIRRDSNTNLNAATPAAGELGFDTTNERLRIGNGTTAGGILLPTAFDCQKQTFLSGDASGTNTVTMTVAPVPAAYVKYQRFVFKAQNTNTGATTINVNSLGAKTVKKRTSGGVADLEGGEIIQDGVYAVVYDGTYMQLESDVSAGGGGAWELLATATASASSTLDFTSVITSDYDLYLFRVKRLRLTTGTQDFLIRTSANNGSTYDSGATNYGHTFATINISSTTAWSGTSATASSINTGMDVDTTAYLTADIYLQDPLNTTGFPTFRGFGTGATAGCEMYGQRRTAAAVNAVRFLPSGSTFASGTIQLYGLRNS